jgi:hypothetical protein
VAYSGRWPLDSGLGRTVVDQTAIHFRRLQEQWGAAVAEIRNLKGYSDEIMLPIVIVLQPDLRVTSGSRIWLCPTATFTFIPLHATHPFRTKANGRRELCPEDVYISSTPTLSALIRSRQTMKKHVTPSFAAIGQSSPGAGQGEVFLTVEGGRRRYGETCGRSFLQKYVQGLGRRWYDGLYEGGLDTEPRYKRREDECAARAADGFHSYWCIVLLCYIALVWYESSSCRFSILFHPSSVKGFIPNHTK